MWMVQGLEETTVAVVGVTQYLLHAYPAHIVLVCLTSPGLESERQLKDMLVLLTLFPPIGTLTEGNTVRTPTREAAHTWLQLMTSLVPPP